MAKKIINVGQAANDRKGDSLRAAFGKVNDNFTELYTALGLNSGGLNIGAFEFSGSTMGTTDSSTIVIDQATTVTSNLSVGGDLLPQTANGGNLGSSSLPWRSLYVSNNTIYIGGTAVGVDQSGKLTVGGVTASTTSNNTLIAGDVLTRDNLSIRIIDNNTSLQIEFRYSNPSVTTKVSASATWVVNGRSDYGRNIWNDSNIKSPGNNTWTPILANSPPMGTVGDTATVFITDHSYHKIYRITAQVRDVNEIGVLSSIYCVIEELK